MPMAQVCNSSLISKLPESLLRQVNDQDWSTDQGREDSYRVIDNSLSQQAEFVQLLGQLTQIEGSPLQKYRIGAEDWKTRGNEAFKIGAWQKAVESYTKALQYAPHYGPSNKVLLAPLFSNRAAALEKLGETAAAVSDCTRAIEADIQFSKAWYRRGKARAVLKDLAGAVGDLERALEVEKGGRLANGLGAETKDVRSDSDVSETGLGARKSAPLSGSAKQIAEELEKVRARLTKGRLQTESQNPRAGASEVGLERTKVDATSGHYPSESDASWSGVEAFHQRGRGRGLRSTRVFDPGDVAITEAPFASVLLKERRASHCHHCFAALPANPLPCSGCAGPLFCSETCRNSALGVRSAETTLIERKRGLNGIAGEADVSKKRSQEGLQTAAGKRETGVDGCGDGSVGVHAHECGGASWAAILPPDAVLAVRVLARLRDKEMSKSASEGARGFQVASLCHHLDRLPVEERTPLLVLACTSARCAIAAGVRTTPAVVLSTIGRLRANVMAVNDVTFGGATDPTSDSLSILNGQQISGRTGRIEAGAQLAGTNGKSLKNHTSGNLSGANEHAAGSETEVRSAVTTSSADMGGSPRVVFEQTQLGQALYPMATLLNHSCDPNAAVSFTGNHVTVRAVKRVGLGEELTLSYGPQKGETRTAERRKWLWERYAFVCNCAACAGDQTSDVLMTGLRCPQTSCEGVVPQHSAVGAFRFPMSISDGPERTDTGGSQSESPPSPSSAATHETNDTNGRKETGAQLGHGGGVKTAGAGVCSDCDIDPPDVVCAECGGRLLCLECDSHVHQPRSKRRGSHVRERLTGESRSRLTRAHSSGGHSETLAGESEGVEKECREDATSAKIEDATSAQVIDPTSAVVACIGPSIVGSGSVEIDRKGTQHADRESTSAEKGASNIEDAVSALSLASGSRESAQSASTIHRASLNETGSQQVRTESSLESSTVSRVESGRCTTCGTSVDVADALARVDAGWAAATGRMPYLEAAERALETAREVLHPLKRKLAEYEDHLAETCAQAGRVEEARRHCAKSLRVLEYHYPRGSLPLAHEYAKLSSLAGAAGQSREASDMTAKAEAIWRAHYGHT